MPNIRLSDASSSDLLVRNDGRKLQSPVTRTSLPAEVSQLLFYV